MLLVSVDTSSAKTLDVFCICWEVYVLTSTKTLDVSNAKTRDVYQWQNIVWFWQISQSWSYGQMLSNWSYDDHKYEE